MKSLLQATRELATEEETTDERREEEDNNFEAGDSVSLLARGHCLLEGVPGLAKSLLISTLAGVLQLKFNRIQFTPDLMPSDITGTEIIEEDTSTGRKAFRFVQGPVFANVILADEINRTPPKTQAALLQAMQEHDVSAGRANA